MTQRNKFVTFLLVMAKAITSNKSPESPEIDAGETIIKSTPDNAAESPKPDAEIARSIFPEILRHNLIQSPPKNDTAYRGIVTHTLGMTEIAVLEFEKRFP